MRRVLERGTVTVRPLKDDDLSGRAGFEGQVGVVDGSGFELEGLGRSWPMKRNEKRKDGGLGK